MSWVGREFQPTCCEFCACPLRGQRPARNLRTLRIGAITLPSRGESRLRDSELGGWEAVVGFVQLPSFFSIAIGRGVIAATTRLVQYNERVIRPSPVVLTGKARVVYTSSYYPCFCAIGPPGSRKPRPMGRSCTLTVLLSRGQMERAYCPLTSRVALYQTLHSLRPIPHPRVLRWKKSGY